MKIAMVSEHANPLACLGGDDAGGQNVHVAALSAALCRLGHQVTVYTRRDRVDQPEVVTAPDGYQVVAVPAGPAGELAKDELLPHMPEFADGLRRRWLGAMPDVVHAHFWMSGVAAMSATGGDSPPVVQTFHALGSVKRRNQGRADTSPPSRVRIERDLGMRVARVAATCSDEVAELAALGVPADRVSVVPCGVDVDHFRPDGPVLRRGRRHRVVTVGRLVPRKGYDTVIRAVAQLPDTELLIVGGPRAAELGRHPEAARLRDCAARAGAADRVRLVGRVSRAGMPALIRSADVVACVPWYEPFGLVPLEAMACGVAVVASAVGGLTDTVLPGVTGALVPPRAPDRLAAVLGSILSDPDGRARLGRAGRERATEMYGWDRVAERTVQVYRHAGASDRSDLTMVGGA